MFNELVEIDSAYQESINNGLNIAYESIKDNKLSCNLTKDKIVIFSDHHRGCRDGADDFMLCEKAYNAALGYYLEAGYTLIILGDAEDLWECRPGPVIKAYKDTLSLEAEFQGQKRYYRVYGNHDDYWTIKGAIDKFFVPQITAESTPVYRGMTLFCDVKPLGVKIFLVHGHQGTFDSDQLSPVSKFFVRNVWRNMQRLLKIKSTTPATDATLKSKHDMAMYSWALDKCKNNDKLILIAGHTHLPVFASRNYIGKIESELKNLQDDLNRLKTEGGAGIDDIVKQVAEKRAELEFIKAKGESKGLDMEKPCYFNTGCCSFSDGDVTGIEISNAEIRLVRWPDDEGNPKAKTLESMSITDLLQSL